mmetsp:Transcript_25221/g.27529  ORF Transcript_25221/g.27529 Transcript_25221/m.27529 type:complete len:106 (+) Transcript_25221:71-388(+)
MSRGGTSKNVVVAGLCILGVGVMGALPYYFTRKMDTLQHKESALVASQRLRGMYVPAGQRDAGRDPDWDLEDNRWKGWERRKGTVIDAEVLERQGATKKAEESNK